MSTKWVLAYEGKRHAARTFEQTRTEVKDYALQNLAANGNWMYCVAAIGRKVAFWKCTRENGTTAKLEPIKVTGGNAGPRQNDDAIYQHDLFDHAADIGDILTYIIAHQP